MASLFFLFCLGMVLPGCLAVLVRDRSPSLPFLQRRTGDVIHHGGGGTSCVVKGSYCQVRFQFHWHKVWATAQSTVQIICQEMFPSTPTLYQLCANWSCWSCFSVRGKKYVEPILHVLAKKSFLPPSALSTLWTPSCTNRKLSSPG